MGAIVSNLVVSEIKVVISLEESMSTWKQKALLGKF